MRTDYRVIYDRNKRKKKHNSNNLCILCGEIYRLPNKSEIFNLSGEMLHRKENNHRVHREHRALTFFSVSSVISVVFQIKK